MMVWGNHEMISHHNQRSGNENTSAHLNAGSIQLESEIITILVFN